MSQRREQWGWYFYDWANSAFSTTVVVVFLGPYLTAIAQSAADTDGFLYPLRELGLGWLWGVVVGGVAVWAGWLDRIYADSYWAYLISLSVVLQVTFLPILGAIADYSHRKKPMLAACAFLGAGATMALVLVTGERYLFGGLLFLIANLSFGASMVFYNAFLPELAAPDERDAVSSRGWAMGYLGGGLLLLLNLLFFSRAEDLGISASLAARLCILSGGLWWAGFTLIPLAFLRTRQPAKRLPPGEHFLGAGFRQLAHTVRSLPRYPQTLLFLVAYLLYNDGVQTVIALLAQFGVVELGLAQDFLIRVILLVQFVAFGGALLFGYLARWIGTKRAIMMSLLVWIGGAVYAYGPLVDAAGFVALAVTGAIVLGGTQALSRSAYSLMIPRGREAEYFSLYEVSERGTSWLGPLLFGLTLQWTASYRVGILSLVVFFILGFVLLIGVDLRRAAVEAGNEAPARG